MCAPSTEARDTVAELINSVIPTNGVQCTTTPKGLIDWIKTQKPATWTKITEILGPSCGDLGYRIAAATATIIRDDSGVRFGTWLVKPRIGGSRTKVPVAA